MLAVINMTRAFALLIASLMFLRGSKADFDYCDGEPRVKTTLHSCNRRFSKPTTLINLGPKISDNPNHALHDTIWALSHYLSKCTSSSRESVSLIIDDRAENIRNISRCSAKEYEVDEMHPPKWGACLAQLLALRNGVKQENFISLGDYRDLMKKEGADVCFDKNVTLGVRPAGNRLEGLGRGLDVSHFRGVSWYGRDCSSVSKDGRLERTPCDDSSTAGSGFSPMPERLKIEAFTTLRKAIFQRLRLPLRRTEQGHRPVHVLLYDRNDTNRRQWVNAEEVYKKLRNDPRIVLKYTRAMPKSFYAQVELYSWADILISPHGAATTNAVFMPKGADIVEIWMYCQENVAANRYKAKDWTGWQAPLLHHNVQYAQCHEVEHPYKKQTELYNLTRGDSTNGFHKVRPDEIMWLFENAMIRQQLRIANLPNP